MKLIYTCHNFTEHNFKDDRVNNYVRNLLVSEASEIIVLDQYLVEKLSVGNDNIKSKISVVTFSSFKEYFEAFDETNNSFVSEYQAWKKVLNIENPDVLLASASYRSLEKFKSTFRNSIYNFLCVVPNLVSNSDFSDNVLVFNNGFVKKEMKELLKNSKVIGLVALDNCSVATSLYMFASFDIPVIVLDVPPMNSIVRTFRIGETFMVDEEIDKPLKLIMNDYEEYSKRCKDFLNDHSWSKSHDVHRKIFHS
jgi:hypothetical protein